VALSRPVIRASIFARSCRLGQLLERGGETERRETQDEAFFLAHRAGPQDSARLTVNENFHINLRDICALASPGGTQVLVSTVAVNLADCPPFGSLHRPGLPVADLAQWEQFCQSATAAESAGRWAEALQQYQFALQLDDQFAELHYRLGTCYAAAGDAGRAREHFQLACDCDALPFRSDSRINGIIRAVAAAQRAPGMSFVDSEAALAQAGGQLFHEHVHFTFHGNYELARTLLPAVAAALSGKLGPAGPAATPLSEAECAQRLAFTEWDELKVLQAFAEAFASAPFTCQLGHAARQQRAAALCQQCEREFQDSARRQRARQVYVDALERAPHDWHLHHNFGELLMALDENKAAANQWQTVAEQFPHRPQFGALRDECRAKAAGRAGAMDPRALEHSGRAKMLLGQKQFDSAIAEYRKALELAPGVFDFHNNLGSALLATGATEDAIKHFKQAIELSPDHADLGLAQMAAKNPRAAIQHLRRARELHTSGLYVPRLLAWLLATANDPALRDGAEAVIVAEDLCEKTGRKFPASLDALAAAYAEAGRFADAIGAAQEAQQLAAAKGDARLAAAIAARLELYRKGQPFREP
jgi:tetratricopeptide (TPR) repeat protein